MAVEPKKSESYGRIIARPAGILAALAIAWMVHARTRTEPTPIPPPVVAPIPLKVAEVPAEPAKPAPRPKREPSPAPVAPVLDQAAVDRAEASLDEAARERARAEARMADAERALQAATVQATADLNAGKSLSSRVRDPSARIAAATATGGFLKGERDRLKRELAAIEKVPQAKAKPLLAKNAVAKPTDGAEYHFEVRRDRVSFIDLDRLVDMVKTDAKLRIRAGGIRGRVNSTVGPVGAFSLRYEMGRALPEALSELVDGRDVSYTLLGWEIMPEGPNRGETFDMTRASSSSYARAVNRLTAGRDTITMWIYPDGFPIYRRLRDELHAKGFLVAARPLPDGTSIKGSPSGSLSAGQ